MKLRSVLACALAGVGVTLGGCTSDYYSRGYAGVDYGYAYPVYDAGYYGWWGGYYYPGTGFYVYDRYRRPYRWSDAQRAYWLEHRYRGTGDASARWDHWHHGAGAPGGFRAQVFHGGPARRGGAPGGHHGHR